MSPFFCASFLPLILSSLRYPGTSFVDESPQFRSLLSPYSSRWLICSWHTNQRALQVGHKSDEAGWGVYEACAERGALIATGHEHSYARSRVMQNVRTQEIVPQTNKTFLPLQPGRSIVFCNGLGNEKHTNNTIKHWKINDNQ